MAINFKTPNAKFDALQSVAKADPVRLIVGDCVEVLKALPDDSVDSVVTDPPYGLGFMGKEFDKLGPGPAQQAWHLRWAKEALRVLKPGGHLIAFGGSRTYHRLASALEDAGFEIRDSVMWLYGSGFPKSRNVSLEVDRLGGDAQRWSDWGTALKPAHEPAVLARKPLAETIGKTVLAHGTGAMNIGACRLPTDDDRSRPGSGGKGLNAYGESETYDSKSHPGGRWPANVIVTDEVALRLGKQGNYFYCPKVSTEERNEGCESLPEKTAITTVERDPDSAGARNPRAGAGRGAGASTMVCAKCGLNVDGGRAVQPCAEGEAHEPVPGEVRPGSKNYHPTVKPKALMLWLIRLITGPGGVVLDPFAGSGSTGMAATMGGFKFIGIEKDPEYALIAKARLGLTQPAHPEF